MTWGILKPLAGALAIAAIVVGLASQIGKSGGSALDPVARAADTTAAAGSAEFGLAGTLGIGGTTTPISGNGTTDLRTGAGRMSLAVNIPGLTNRIQVDEIFTGSTFYLHYPPELTSRLPGAKPWIKIDLADLAGIDSAQLKQLAQANQQNPGDLLQALKAVGNSKVVGQENIGGAPTTHYHSDIDLDKIASAVADQHAADSVKALFDQAGVSTMPVDVWVDRSGRVRRESLELSAQQVTISMTIEFTRFGVQVDTTPPPADQVLDGGALLKAAGGG